MKELGGSSCLPWNHGCPHGRWYDFTLAGEFVPTMITATFEILNLPNDQMVTSKVGRAGPLWRHANLLRLALRMVWWTPTISACWVPRWTWHLAVSGFQRLIDAHLLGPMCCLPSNREHRESYIVIFIPLCRGVICRFSGSPTSCMHLFAVRGWYDVIFYLKNHYSNSPWQFLGPSLTLQKVPEPRNVFGFLSKYDPSWAPNHIDDTARWPPGDVIPAFIHHFPRHPGVTSLKFSEGPCGVHNQELPGGLNHF